MAKQKKISEQNIDKKDIEEIKVDKKYTNPGQWLGNRPPITRTDK